MSQQPREASPEYQRMREYVLQHGSRLRKQYGAHGIGVGRKTVDGVKTDQLAIRFYVAQKRPAAECGAHAIPPALAYSPEGSDDSIELATDVVEAPPAEEEGEG